MGHKVADNARKTSLNSAQSLKVLVDDYIAKNRLPDPTNQRFVRLDGLLAKAVNAESGNGQDRMAKEEVVKRLKAGVAWSVSIGGQVK